MNLSVIDPDEVREPEAPGENAPRLPEHVRELEWLSRGVNNLSDACYRNYLRDEAKVKPCELPALLLTPEGAAISDAASWERYRPRLRKLFADCLYGDLPPPPDRIRLRFLSRRDDALAGLAFRREIRIYCERADGRSHNFDLLVYIPKSAVAHPAPVFVGLNGPGNHAITPELDVRIPRGPTGLAGNWWAVAPLTAATRGTQTACWNLVGAVKRGYAVATAHYGELFPDNPEGYRQSIYTLFHGPEALAAFKPIGDPYDRSRLRRFGALSAWAWGLSRILDVLAATEPLIDTSRAAVIGHSRLGKAACWAGACDERFRLVISNCSGHPGAALTRRRFGETLLQLALVNAFWFSEDMLEYSLDPGRLPLDQHQLLALVAPRALYVASATLDDGADPRGEFLAAQAASPAWALYGLTGLAAADIPVPDIAMGDRVGYHLRTGGHGMMPWDWERYYDFADRCL